MDVSRLIEQVQGNNVSGLAGHGVSLRRVIDMPNRYLEIPSGAALEQVRHWASSYYGDFYAFISGDPRGRDRYMDRLKQFVQEEGSQLRSLVFRATQVWASKEYALTYQEAAQVVTLLNPSEIPLSVDDCLELVMDNYLSMVESPDPHLVIGRLGPSGRGRIVEGIHRALINQAKGAKVTPFAILERDNEWIDFVSFFRAQGESLYEDDGVLYQGIDHPDFADWRVIREDRSGPILAALSASGVKRALDLGSMVGYYTHKLAVDGIAVTAVEYEEQYARALRVLSDLYGVSDKVTVRREDIYARSYLANEEQYDAVLMLSIVYHLMRRDQERCIEWLGEIKSRFNTIVIDTEPRTGVLPRERVLELFQGFDAQSLYKGKDDREILLFSRSVT